jgi:hypothetical protein
VENFLKLRHPSREVLTPLVTVPEILTTDALGKIASLLSSIEFWLIRRNKICRPAFSGCRSFALLLLSSDGFHAELDYVEHRENIFIVWMVQRAYFRQEGSGLNKKTSSFFGLNDENISLLGNSP